MAELKTRPTKSSVSKFLNAVEDETRRKDSFTILKLMEEITGHKAVMWGTSIVGFGSYNYSNTLGDAEWPITGFSPRKQALTIYMMSGFDVLEPTLKKLGKYKLGKSCLYIKTLAEIDLDILKKLILESLEYMKKTYPIIHSN